MHVRARYLFQLKVGTAMHVRARCLFQLKAGASMHLDTDFQTFCDGFWSLSIECQGRVDVNTTEDNETGASSLSRRHLVFVPKLQLRVAESENF